MISRRKPSLLGPAMAWFYPAWVCLACTLIFAQRKGQLFTGSRSMLAAGLLMCGYVGVCHMQAALRGQARDGGSLCALGSNPAAISQVLPGLSPHLLHDLPLYSVYAADWLPFSGICRFNA